MKRFFLILLFFLIFLAGCRSMKNSSSDIKASYGWKSYVSPISSYELIAGGKELTLTRGPYLWRNTSQSISDIISFMVSLRPIQIHRGTRVDIIYKNNRHFVSVRHWKTSAVNEKAAIEDKVENNSIILPDILDTYLYEIRSEWTDGYVNDYFLARIQ